LPGTSSWAGRLEEKHRQVMRNPAKNLTGMDADIYFLHKDVKPDFTGDIIASIISKGNEERLQVLLDNWSEIV
jgi:hypothetical protein